MRQKLLLFLMVVSFGALYAQDTIRSVVISEVRYDRADMAYIELTNMGADTVDLGEFELLSHSPWDQFPDGRTWPTEPHRVGDPANNNARWLMLPSQPLAPGQSWVAATFHDWTEEDYARKVRQFGYAETGEHHRTKPELKKLTDLQIHRPESPTSDPTDSVSPYSQLLESWSGRDVIYLRHHPPGADSCVVDQVGGTFDDVSGNGTNPDGGRHDVAGVSQASANSVLVRKFDVKEGNLTWVRGNDISESEWIPVPILREGGDKYEPWRAVFWTVHNHGDFHLNETTFTSSSVDIDWDNNILHVPWWVRNDDSIIYQFDRTPGLAWHYQYNNGDGSSEDSSFVSVRTGDSLAIYVCGNTLEYRKFRIEAMAEPADANMVIPLRMRNPNNNEYPENGAVFQVSHNKLGVMDTISDIQFATRVDTLLKYLYKPMAASWTILWDGSESGPERTDLLDGDILRVTASDGTMKDYYLKVNEYRKFRNAYLSSITWPDIPDDYRDILGWVQDTIPEFNRAKFSYKITVPWDVEGIPALVAKNEDPNGSHTVKRATNLAGSPEDRTTAFTSYAENDTSFYVYNVLMEREKRLEDIEPWAGEPFISQFTWKTEFSHTLVEIVNPGNQPLDISNYMFFCGYENDPVNAIAGWSDWNDRYQKYIPGFVWQDSADWVVEDHIAVQDVSGLTTIVYPGDVFVMAEINLDDAGAEAYLYHDQIDVDFRHPPWGGNYSGATAVYQWNGMNFYMWKIKNDSIKLGLKAANDPDDFELLETFGSGDGSAFAPVGTPTGQVTSYTRKPEIWHGEPVAQASFGATPEESQWIAVDEQTLQAKGYGWPQWRTQVPEGTGSHFMNDVTVYRSTVGSLLYKVSEGYGPDQEIRGVVTGTTVEDFFGNVLKADTAQSLKVVSSADGMPLDSASAVMNGDTLVVTSADSVNVSKYVLEVGSGLSTDAVLTSTMYTIAVDGDMGTVSGFDYGTTLKAVREGVEVPAGAVLTIVDDMDAYVPFKRLNYDTMYVDVLVSDMIFFEVVAEDGATEITYQLMPNATSSDAFVTSEIFEVDQERVLISLIPKGINVENFLANLIPAPGATLQLFDKLGFERNLGEISLDDRLVVTSEDGNVTTTYYLTILEEEANYLAYVTSIVYTVDQDGLAITGVTGTQTVATFKGNVEPATGATLEVQDASGAAKGDADTIVTGDWLQVTAGNGVNVVTYSITVTVNIEEASAQGISIYPNPSAGLVNVAGADPGSRIRVYNAVGASIRDIVVNSGIQRVSLEDQPDGMYYITISNNDDVVGRFKVIKQ